jgi:hypothetical protein
LFGPHAAPRPVKAFVIESEEIKKKSRARQIAEKLEQLRLLCFLLKRREVLKVELFISLVWRAVWYCLIKRKRKKMYLRKFEF